MGKGSRWSVVVSLLCMGTAYAGPTPLSGIPDDAPFVSVDPRVDGADSFAGEWTGALRTDDTFVDPTTLAAPAGHFYYENRRDWAATSSSGGVTTYPGTTFFVAHDIWGGPTGLFTSFRSNDPGDWNYVMVRAPDGTVVECWNFAGFTGNAPPHADVNALDDGLWITDAVGLGSSSLIPEGTGTDLIDDRGFIVRKNRDPATDRHWFPGSPEPGDATWDWDAYYGCFARAGFNQTFQGNGTDPTPAHAFDHEVYEWCFHGTVSALPSPLECFEWEVVWIDPPKRAVIFFAPNFLIHLGNPPVPSLPWPFVLALAGVFAAGGALAFRRRGRGRGVRTALLTLALAIGLTGCGGGNGGGTRAPRRSSPSASRRSTRSPRRRTRTSSRPRGRAPPSRTRWRPARRSPRGSRSRPPEP